MQSYLSALYECSEAGEYTRIVTPFVYPDGDAIAVFCKQSGEGYVATDFGDTMNWLSSNTISTSFGSRQRKLIEDTASLHKVDMFKSNIHGRCSGPQELAGLVNAVGQAASRISDVSFTFRSRNIVSTEDEVAEYLGTVEGVDVERGVTKTGVRSSKPHRFNFETRTEGGNSLVLLLACGTKGATAGLVQRSVATWYDMQDSSAPSQFVSLFDDTVDVWSSSDFAFLDSISNVARWSEPDEFLSTIKVR